MKIIDISMPIHEQIPVYKNDPGKKPSIKILRDFKQGAKTRESRLDLELHTGTHLDAPLHMIEGGMDSRFFRLEDMVVKCKVLDFTPVSGGITDEDLKKKRIEEADYLLLKTKNSFDQTFNMDFIYLAESGARYLVDKGVRGVGIDALGIERNQLGHPTHKLLLANGIYILEGLRLKEVKEGSYTLIAAPLNIIGVEASPVRALLLDK
ncbi:MAG: cyclase family protein [Caldicoprobacterales bacterium]|jgi:arylformamidase|nr:cyclase family protein [Clostridia bacterium]NLH59642.1 cyclase family protein [Clostridiales bacterium]